MCWCPRECLGSRHSSHISRGIVHIIKGSQLRKSSKYVCCGVPQQPGLFPWVWPHLTTIKFCRKRVKKSVKQRALALAIEHSPCLYRRLDRITYKCLIFKAEDGQQYNRHDAQHVHKNERSLETSLNDVSRDHTGALERIRTSDLWYRKPMLYPLSYEGGTEQGYQSG